MAMDLRVLEDLAALAAGAAEHLTAVIRDSVRQRGACSLVLSGGETPRPLYGLLATRFRDRIPWAHVHVFWADERYVPSEDSRNNAGMARALMLEHVPCPAGQVHPMPTSLASPDEAARDYERTLRTFVRGGPPQFDVAILGMGQEGHTASIFPGSPALAESERWVLPVTVPADPATRLTLTMPVLTQAAHIELLVSGSTKAVALRHLRHEGSDPTIWPAAALRSSAGTLTVWADRAAVVN